MKHPRLLLLLICVLWAAGLRCSEAEAMLSEPRLQELISEYQFLSGNGALQLKEEKENLIVGGFTRNSITNPSQTGHLSFRVEGKEVKILEFPNVPMEDSAYSRNHHYCLVRNDSTWAMYNFRGEWVRHYQHIGWGYRIYDVSETGNVIWLKQSDDWFQKFTLGVIVTDKDSKIIYHSEELLGELDIAFTEDGSYCAFLEKELVIGKSGPQAKDASRLRIFDSGFNCLYQHVFDQYYNHSNSGSNFTMTFINHVLFMAVRYQQPVMRHKQWNFDHTIRFVTVDAEAGMLYQREEKEPQISRFALTKYVSPPPAKPVNPAVSFLSPPRFQGIVDSLIYYQGKGKFNFREVHGTGIQVGAWSPPRRGELTFRVENRIIKKMDLNDVACDYLFLSRDKQNCLLKDRDKWNWYNLRGVFSGSYVTPGAGYMPVDISSSGTVLFFKGQQYETGPAEGVIILSREGRIVYRLDKPMAQFTIAFSRDGHYTAILMKESGVSDCKPLSYRHPSTLMIFDAGWEKVYERFFSKFLNHYSCYDSSPIAFVNHVLFMVVTPKINPFVTQGNGRYCLGSYFAAIDAETGRAFQRGKTTGKVTELPELKPPAEPKRGVYTSEAEWMLHSERFLDILDTLKFQVKTATFDYDYSLLNKVDTRYLTKYRYNAPESLMVSFIIDSKVVKEFPFTLLAREDIEYSRNRQSIFIRNAGKWDWYNSSGEMVHSYPLAEKGYRLYDITSTGHVIYLKYHPANRATIGGVMIVDPGDKVIYRNESPLEEAEVCFREDGKFYSVLTKRYIHRKYSWENFAPDSDLTVYDADNQVVYTHHFVKYVNQNTSFASHTMHFFGDVLFMADAKALYQKGQVEKYDYLRDVDFVAIDYKNGKLYKRKGWVDLK